MKSLRNEQKKKSFELHICLIKYNATLVSR